VTYVIVETEGEGDRVVAFGRGSARLPVPPLALAGGLVRGLALGGRSLARLTRRISIRGHRT
jgi:hypothetical protein